MFQHLLSFRKSVSTPSLFFLLTGLFFLSSAATHAQTVSIPQNLASVSPMNPLAPSFPPSPYEPAINQSQEQPQQVDPLDSPYPIPWSWIMDTQEEFSQKNASGFRYYRSPSLISPDGKYAAYTRLQMQVEPELFRSRVTSVLFLEDLSTGDLQVIQADSPLAKHLLEVGEAQDEAEELMGAISILMPVSWSANGDRLLARQFEGFFSTSDASDYAVIWNRQTNQMTTLSPNETEAEYNQAVLLGWNQEEPEQVLFQAGLLGEEDWSVWSVALNGQTALARQNHPITYGQMVSHSWTGSQALK
jgi:hypothetical protein